MILEVLNVVAPVLSLACIGFVWARLGYDYDTAFVSRMALNVAGPCLVFSTLATVDLAPEFFGTMTGAALSVYALSAAGAAALLGVARLPLRVYLPGAVFGNTGNLGLPLALFAFGQEGLALALIVFAVSSVLTVAVSSWLGSGEPAPWRELRAPIVIAAGLGVAAALLEVRLPDWMTGTLSLAGQMMIPMMLLTLGVSIARLDWARLDRPVLLALGRIGLGAAAGLATAELMGLEGAARGVIVLQAMTPTAVTVYLFAERYDAEPRDVAGLVVVSTLMSVVALPTALALLL